MDQDARITNFLRHRTADRHLLCSLLNHAVQRFALRVALSSLAAIPLALEVGAMLIHLSDDSFMSVLRPCWIIFEPMLCLA